MPDRPSLFAPDDNCWRVARAGQAAVIVDAADYFRFARAAMLTAKRQILLIGWDFDGSAISSPGWPIARPVSTSICCGGTWARSRR
jgi:hypothetical protein